MTGPSARAPAIFSTRPGEYELARDTIAQLPVLLVPSQHPANRHDRLAPCLLSPSVQPFTDHPDSSEDRHDLSYRLRARRFDLFDRYSFGLQAAIRHHGFTTTGHPCGHELLRVYVALHLHATSSERD